MRDEVIEVGESDVDLLDDDIDLVEVAAPTPPPPLRPRRLSSPSIRLELEDVVAGDVLASLGAEASRARESESLRVKVANVPAAPRPPRASSPSFRAALPAVPRPSRLPPVSPPPQRIERAVVADQAETLPKFAPPPPPSYSDLEETIPYSAPSPAGLIEYAERPRARKETPNAFVRGRETVPPSIAPVALANDHTVLLRRPRSRTTFAAAAAVAGAVAAVLAMRLALPAAFAAMDERPIQAFAAPLPRMHLPAAPPPAKELRFDEKDAIVVGAVAPPVHVVHPTPPSQTSSPPPAKMPDGSLGLGARVEAAPPKPAPAPKPEAAPATKTEAAPTTTSKKLTPEQELADAQLKASMR